MAVEEASVPVRICRVADGEEALRFLQRSNGHEDAPRPDLILLNVNLPKKDGFQVLVEVRATESIRSIPVVMFTSSSRDSERKKALALGAEDFISKPKSLNELIATLTTVCERFLI
jgi:CheY-like chemotaxis protein